MDEADVAQFCIDQTVEQAVLAARKGVVLPRDGSCANCGEPAQANGLFCGKDCSADHEARERHQLRAGLR